MSPLSVGFGYTLSDNGGEKGGKVVPSVNREKGSSGLLEVVLSRPLTSVSIPVQSWVLSVGTFPSVSDLVLACRPPTHLTHLLGI